LADPLDKQIEQLRHTIATLEAQRSLLGADAVDTVLTGLHAQLAALEAQQPPAPSEERRLITILFTDIVGSTSLAEKLDPEEWRQTVARVHSAAGSLIAAHGGKVAQYLGDGLLALFGSELASEEDPEQAIRAALEIQKREFETAGASAADVPASRVSLRIGIHTGLVVLGELGADSHKEFTATGDAMNLAARLQSAAPPAGILISHDTYRYVRGVFDVTPQPPLTLKGKPEPVQTYLVRRAKPRAFRMTVRGVAGLQTRTIGRGSEFTALQSAYRKAYEEHRMVTVQMSGEAGIGKSRLVDDLGDWLELRPEMFRLLRARAFAGDAAQPYALVRRLWFDRFQIAEDVPLAQAEAKWVRGFREFSGSEAEEPAHALGLLLGLPFEKSPFIGAMRQDPTQVRGRAFVVSRELLRTLRRDQPVVVLLEDLQWIDPASREYVQEVFLAEERTPEQARQGLFVVMTGRPEWKPPDAPAPGLKSIALAPLSDAATRELAGELLREVGGPPQALVDLIVERAEGNPYYAEELVNWFLDHGILDAATHPWRFFPQRLKESPLPATLQHLLLTRLTALSDGERGALQRGAIFGRRFWSGGVEALGVRRSSEMLAPLEPRGLVRAQPESSFVGEREWSFSQTLLRDVTYESVLKRERAGMHRTAAEWLEAQAERAGRLDEFAGLIGEHCEQAGELTRAAEWYLRAGERGLASYALDQAQRLFDRALELLPPVERERRWRGLMGREQVLDLRGEREAQQQDIDALLELAEALDDDQRRSLARFKQLALYVARGEYRASLPAGEAAIAAAQRARDPALELKALAYQTVSLRRLGELEAAGEAASKTLQLAEVVDDQTAVGFALGRLAVYYQEVQDPSRSVELYARALEIARQAGDRSQEANCVGNVAVTYINVGLYKQARTALEQALALSEALGYRRSRGYFLLNLAAIHNRMHEGRAARQVEEAALAEATAVGDVNLIGVCTFSLGEIAEQAGDFAGATRYFTELEERAARLGLPPGSKLQMSAALARCALAQGQLHEARRRATEIWSFIREHGTARMYGKMRTLQTVADIFDALGEPAEAQAAVEMGYREVIQDADKITDPKWRKSFLENVEENRAILEMWERMHR
jgi:class 3 adenylate cyclase/predicted ATPase